MGLHLLAIDQGTTSTRTIVFRDDLTVAAVAQEEFPQHYPASGWVEHDPEDLWRTTVSTMREAIARAGIGPAEIAGIGITNQRETTVVWERSSGRAIHPAIVWQDRRTADVCATLREDPANEALVAARTGLRVALNLCEDEPRPGDAVATALFRILQEALTNVARHAQASEVQVSLHRTENAWRLTISDDGVGAIANEAVGTGFGLVSMRERLQILGGRFELRSAPGAGTVVVAQIPVEVVDDDVATQDPSAVGR